MGQWLQRIRGAVGMGLTWAVAWSAVGAVPRWVLGLNPDAPFPLIFGVLGFFAGVAFSGVLALAEGRRRFEHMSLPRFAAWGALGGILVAGGFVAATSLGGRVLLALAPAFAGAGAVCAAGSLVLARRALPGGSAGAVPPGRVGPGAD